MNVRHTLSITLLFITSVLSSQETDLNPLNYFTQSEIDQANTAQGVDYLTQEEIDIYLYTNLVRLFPKKFYELYSDYVIAEGKENLLNSNSYYTTLTKSLKTKEAVSAVYPDREMFELAECWAIESGKKGVTGHNRKDCPKGYDGENCAYGVPEGMRNVMLLLIDYGVQNLGHRVNLFNPDWKGMGAAIRPHKDFGMCAVQDFSRTNDQIKEDERRREGLIEKRQEEFANTLAEWDKNEWTAADANRKAKYLNDFEKDFYLYLNLMRVNPSKFKSVVWDQGPYFDRLPSELESGVRTTDQYKAVSKWLEDSNGLEVLAPNKKRIEELKCVIERFKANNSNYRSCFKSPGAWQFATYQSESNFNDFINILLNSEDFERIFKKNAIVALENDEGTGIKVFLME